MKRWVTIGAGGMLVVSLAIWSDRAWRTGEEARRNAAIENEEDPELIAEVRAALIARRARLPSGSPKRLPGNAPPTPQ